jgi:hypothetical protein
VKDEKFAAYDQAEEARRGKEPADGDEQKLAAERDAESTAEASQAAAEDAGWVRAAETQPSREQQQVPEIPPEQSEVDEQAWGLVRAKQTGADVQPLVITLNFISPEYVAGMKAVDETELLLEEAKQADDPEADGEAKPAVEGQTK